MSRFKHGQRPQNRARFARAIDASSMGPLDGVPGDPPHEPPTDESVLRTRSVSALVVLDRLDADLTSLVCGFHSHVTLVCVGTQQAAQVIDTFAPDIVLVDMRLPDSLHFARQLALGSDRILVAVHSPETLSAELCDRQFPFHYRLERPVLRAEIEQFLWQIAERPTRRLDVGGRRSQA